MIYIYISQARVHIPYISTPGTVEEKIIFFLELPLFWWDIFLREGVCIQRHLIMVFLCFASIFWFCTSTSQKKQHPKPSIHPPSRGSFSAQAPPCPCSSNRDVITSTIQSVKHGLPICKTFLRIGVCESNKHPLCKWWLKHLYMFAPGKIILINVRKRSHGYQAFS